MNPATESNLATIAEVGGRVLAFPSAEAAEEAAVESKSRKEVSKERAQALKPYFRIWIKSTIGKDIAQAYRAGNDFSITLSCDWLINTLFAKTNIPFLKKKIEEDKKQAPDVPENLTAWDVMRGLMGALRSYNYGMGMNKTGYIIDATSNHKQTQSMITGETVWVEPTEVKLDLWRVINNDYEEPWKLEWVKNPLNPEEKIQIKVYTKVASVLKPWEQEKKAEPELDDEQSNMLRLAQLVKGEFAEFKFNGDHQSEVEEERENFRGLVNRISQSNNARFRMTEPDENSVIVYHEGLLYR